MPAAIFSSGWMRLRGLRPPASGTGRFRRGRAGLPLRQIR